MKKCVFCQIVKEQTKQKYRIFYTDSKYITMLVSNPETRGHFILFPKAHFSQIAKLSNKEKFFELAVKLAEEKTAKLGAKAYSLKLNNKLFLLDDNPLHVGHIHIHIIPRYAKDDFDTKIPDRASVKLLSEVKSQIS